MPAWREASLLTRSGAASPLKPANTSPRRSGKRWQNPYVALPDKDATFNTRNLRLKALKSAVDHDEDEDKEGEEEEGSTSSSEEEPPYDDHMDSDSAPSEEEMAEWRQQKTLTQKTSKRKLFLWDQQSGPKTPKKCKIVMKKLGTPITKYYMSKTIVSKPLEAPPVELAAGPAPAPPKRPPKTQVAIEETPAMEKSPAAEEGTAAEEGPAAKKGPGTEEPNKDF
ncbi:uncharacterized protein LOC114563528 [Perca flavescens]|uniref:uncharacterized protein LOC114563528 n=1 Tax=Perca flavescens TaxID=8167 RepID=UPI00106ECF16|nr:uncharacterized protein LOC114563528 [Perca flavescens]